MPCYVEASFLIGVRFNVLFCLNKLMWIQGGVATVVYTLYIKDMNKLAENIAQKQGRVCAE